MILEKTQGPDHPSVANSLHGLAILYTKQGKLEEAEPLFQRSLSVGENPQGPDHQSLVRTLQAYAQLLRDAGRIEEAEEREARAKAILAKHQEHAQ